MYFSKLRTNVQCKLEFHVEKNISMNLQKYLRSIFAQFRCGVLSITVETLIYRDEVI